MVNLKFLVFYFSLKFSSVLTLNYIDSNFGFINKKNEKFTVKLHEPFELQCQFFIDKQSDYTVKWFNETKDLLIIPAHVTNIIEEIDCKDKYKPSVSCYISRLNFSFVCLNDIGKYECVLLNDLHDAHGHDRQLKFMYQKPIVPQIYFNYSSKVCLGSNSSMYCSAFPVTNDWQIFMQFGNRIMAEKVQRFDECSNKTKTLVDNQPIEYRIINAQLNDSGEYECNAYMDSENTYKFKKIKIEVVLCKNSEIESKTFQIVYIGIISGVATSVLIIGVFCIKKKISSGVIPKYNKFLHVDIEKNILSMEFLETFSIKFSNEIELHSLKLIKILGNGEFGEVFLGKAINKIDNKDTFVAVKFLKHQFDEISANFMMEKDIMANLSYHENVIRYIGFLNLPDKIAIVMEYAKNGSLLNMLKKFQQTPSHANEFLLCQFGIDVASGMEYLSSMNLVHRDLAARNVFVSEFLVLKIGDFGLTREAYDYYRQTNTGKVPIRWLALESLLFKKYSTMSDVWTFGILLWEIFSLGQTPYPDVPDISLLTNLIIHGKRNFKPPFCSIPIYNIMQRTWKSLAIERPSFNDLRLELKDILPKCSSILVRYD